jgi:hypothetical protein
LQDALSLIPANKDASTSGGLVDAIIEVGRKRQRLMESLRGDDAEALQRARELTGISRKRPTSTMR